MKISANHGSIDSCNLCRNGEMRQSSGRSLSSNSSSGRLSVRFGDIQVYEFPQVLGDNPACSAGPPLTLDWKPITKTTMLLDFYEFSRSPRRNSRDLMESNCDRQKYLIGSGVRLEEIVEALIAVENTKRDRSDSLKKQNRPAFFKGLQLATTKTAIYAPKIFSTSFADGGSAKSATANSAKNTSNRARSA